MQLIKMVEYTLQQCMEVIIVKFTLKMVKTWQTVCKTKIFFGRCEANSWTAIQILVEKMMVLGQVSDKKNKALARRSRTSENIAA